MSSQQSNDQERVLQELSALTDGECEPGQLLSACDVWRRDGRARSAWHTYALIGDVMRSDDLASPAAHDAQFLQTLRARLAQEPVVLAPSAPPARPAESYVEVPVQSARMLVAGAGGRATSRRGWVAPAAVAAGFAVVTGAMVVAMRSAPPEGSAPTLALTSTPQGAPRADTQFSTDAEAELVRNPELDRYLNAHRQYTLGPALAGPGGVRQVAMTPGGR